MKQVVVRPERCVGCMQCMLACAVAHSGPGDLYSAVSKTPAPKPRVYVGYSMEGRGFPNRCRHCLPAPCITACFPGAIYRQEAHDTVLVDEKKCIRCASCAMACPFGVIRYHPSEENLQRTVAKKCDNCIQRQEMGMIPACVEACKTGALIFEKINLALKKRTQEVSGLMGPKVEETKGNLPITWSSYVQFREVYEMLGKAH